MTPQLRHRTINQLLVIMLAGLLLLMAGSTWARTSDRNQPLDLHAGGLDGPIAQSGDTLLTDVIITQGTLRIEAEHATITRLDGEVTKVVMNGTPASLQQENDEGVLMTAKAQRIDYDTNSETVLLTGAVQIDQGRDTFRGERVSYDSRNGHIKGDGGPGGRIHLTIQPKSPPAEPAKN